MRLRSRFAWVATGSGSRPETRSGNRCIEVSNVNTPIRQDTREKLIHVHSMLRELKNIVEAERCDMLAHLIEMAYLESGDILRGSRPVRSSGFHWSSAPRTASDRGK
jgi:hypothetical protein